MSAEKPTPRAKGLGNRKRRQGGEALAAVVLGGPSTSESTSSSGASPGGPMQDGATSGQALTTVAPDVPKVVEATAQVPSREPIEPPVLPEGAVDPVPSMAKTAASPLSDHAHRSGDSHGGEESVRAGNGGVGAAVGDEAAVSSAGDAAKVSPSSVSRSGTAGDIDGLLRPEAWSGQREDGTDGGPISSATPVAPVADVDDDDVQDRDGVEDTIHVSVYLTRVARQALRRARKVTGIPIAVLAMNAIDEAVRGGRLRELVEVRHVETRPPDSVFPNRRTRRRQSRADGTSSSKVLQQLLMTEGEIQTLADLEPQYGALNRSELVAAAVEAKYDPKAVERLRSHAVHQWGGDQPLVQHLD